MEGPTQALYDIDGDGWLDIGLVRDLFTGDNLTGSPTQPSGGTSCSAVTGQLVYYPHEGARGAGWSDTAVVLFSAENLRSLATTRGWVERPEDVVVDPLSSDYETPPKFGQIDTLSGLRDVNGDGLVDYVDTRYWQPGTTTPSGFPGAGNWAVWLNRGDGQFDTAPRAWVAPVGWLSRSVEGYPSTQVLGGVPQVTNTAIERFVAIQGEYDEFEYTAADFAPGASALPGLPSSVVTGLLDMDGDGREDLVNGETLEWYRNLGARFHATGQSLPLWFPTLQYARYPAAVGTLSVSGTHSTVGSGNNTSATTEWVRVADINGDRLPDVVDKLYQPDNSDVIGRVLYSGSRVQTNVSLEREAAKRSSQPVNVPVVPGGATPVSRFDHPPHLLEKIEQATGAETQLWYGSSAHSKSRPVDDHQTPSTKPLVRISRVRDPLTGWRSWRRHEYQEGKVELGRWWGFRVGLVQEYLRDDISSYQRIGTTETVRELSLWYALPVERFIGDASPGPVTVPAMGTSRYRWSHEELGGTRWQTTWTYWPNCGTNTGSNSASIPLPEKLEAHPCEIQSYDAGTQQAGTRQSMLGLEWDEWGNLERQIRSAAHEDTLQVDTTWDRDGALSMPSKIVTRTTPHQGLVSDVVEELRFGLQLDRGLVMSETACVELTGSCAVSLTWKYQRTARGALESIEEPGGRTTTFLDLAFGGTTPLRTQNALLHETTTILDASGRVVGSTDPNGVREWISRDGFGRPLARDVQGATGASGTVPAVFRRESVVYHDQHVPRQVVRQRYRDNSPSVVGVDVLDGFGSPIQQFEPLGSAEWVVSEAIRDTRGHLRQSNEPYVVQQLPAAGASLALAGAVSSTTSYDVFGEPKTTFDIHTGTRQFSYPMPGERLEIDDEGFKRLLKYDTLGRLVEVMEGRGAPTPWQGGLVRTGSYRYDGRGRVTQYTDGEGNQWRYSFDGAGRQIIVERSAPSSPLWTRYYTLNWEGADPVRIHEGTADASPEVEWVYDALGRNTEQRVWNPVTGTYDTSIWTWDAGVSGTWLGALHALEDTSGVETRRYDEVDGYGRQGWVTNVSRSFSAAAVTADFAYDYDEEGRTVRKVWPSGAEVTSVYGPDGRLLSQADGTRSVQYHFDSYGLESGWMLEDVSTTPARAWTHVVSRANSKAIQSLQWNHGTRGGDKRIDYQYWANGLLDKRIYDAANSIGLDYDYDEFGRINEVADLGSPAAFYERYAYDRASNLTHADRSADAEADGVDKAFQYIAPFAFNEVQGRDTSSTTREVYDWGAQSRLTTVLHREYASPGSPTFVDTPMRRFDYDGMSRVVEAVRHDPSLGAGRATRRTFEYGAENTIVVERTEEIDESVSPTAVLSTTTLLRFDGWRYDESTGVTIEQRLPMARDDGSLRVVYLEPDGRAPWTRGLQGDANQEVLGAYGQPIAALTVGTRWELDSLHGSEQDLAFGVTHFGRRHMNLGDGMWLQPEPLLGLGLSTSELGRPLALGATYAAGNSNHLSDESGLWAEALALDVPSIAIGVGSFIHNVSEGNYGWATLDAVGVAFDVAMMATPGVPGAAGIAIQASRRGADDLAGAVAGATRANTTSDVASTTQRVAKAGDGCFVAGTEVASPRGPLPIEEVVVGFRVLAAASTDGAEEPWVEVVDEPVEDDGAWASRGVCDRLTAWSPKWAIPAMVALAACGAEPELPTADEVVQVYDARTGDWSEAVGAKLEVGDTWLDDGRLRRWTDDGVEDRCAATVEDLAEADATWTAEAATRVPGTDEWVLVLGEADEAGHWKLGAVEAGEQFAFRGRVFETADADGDGLIEVRPTGDVLGRVVNTFVRVAPEVIDADIEYADGSYDTLTGTPNHPFWVAAVRDYVPLGELEVGTVLHVQGGGEAILVGKTWRQGDFEVFDFEVEGLHNFYVRGPGSDAAGVLVHNSTGGGPPIRGGGPGRGGGGGGGGGGGRQVYPRGPGASSGPTPDGSTRVSRWMSEGEASQWIDNGGTFIPGDVGGQSGRVFVTRAGDAKPGGTGPVRVDFDITSDALTPAGSPPGSQWSQIFQPTQNTPIDNVIVNYPD
ncbi:MAG: polymorphic toxin-type HINT domain-containing protein [Myxococcota bacterium]